MAVQVIEPQVIKQQSGILGTLGNLASLGGMMTGQPWLTALGTGMSGVDTLMNGDGTAASKDEVAKKTGEAWKEIYDRMKARWKNVTEDNVTKKKGQVTAQQTPLGMIATAGQPIAAANRLLPFSY